jgi:hypothetical protein
MEAVNVAQTKTCFEQTHASARIQRNFFANWIDRTALFAGIHASMTERGEEHRERPDGVEDATVEAVGALSEALEWVERARGELYSFHQLMGRADLLLGEACDKLRDAGHQKAADRLQSDLVGRNVLYGRWTFQIVEEFDDNYWSVFRDHEARVRGELQNGVRHLFESEMKERRRSHGRTGHERRPHE